MTALHQQLLDATGPLIVGDRRPGGRTHRATAALRAVVELHKPAESWCSARTNEDGEWEERAVEVDGQVVALDGVTLTCFAEKVPADWPCSTVLAIARELGIEVAT